MVSKCGVIYGKRGAQRVKKSIEKNNKEKSDKLRRTTNHSDIPLKTHS